jgi:hypothetical protein
MKELNIQVPEGYEVDKEKSTFEKIIFKKIENKLPKTWEEFCEQNPTITNEYYIRECNGIGCYNSRYRDSEEDKNLLSTKEDVEAHLALIQLHRLRDVYRQGWVPDWRNSLIKKYCIVFSLNNLDIYQYTQVSHFLAFQSQEVAEEFLKNFKDLIEIAKDLI